MHLPARASRAPAALRPRAPVAAGAAVIATLVAACAPSVAGAQASPARTARPTPPARPATPAAAAEWGTPPAVACEPTPGAATDTALARKPGTVRDSAGVCYVVLRSEAEAPQHAELWVRVDGLDPAAPGPSIVWKASSGTLAADTGRVTVTRPAADAPAGTPATGAASVEWSRASGAATTVVTASVTTSAGTASRTFVLAPTTAAKPKYRVVVADGTDYDRPRYTYEKSRAGGELVVEVVRDVSTPANPNTFAAVTDTTECIGQHVIWRRVGTGGIVTPDSAIPALVTYKDYEQRRPRAEKSGKARCLAFANWTVGEGFGYSDVRASIAPGNLGSAAGPVAEFRAFARVLPRVVGGLALTWEKNYNGKRSAPFTVRTLTRPVDPTNPALGTVAFSDTVRNGRDTVASLGRGTTRTAVLGITGAPYPRWRFLSATVGVDAAKPTDNWFAGVSALRALRAVGWATRWSYLKRLETEHLPVDLHALAHIGRIDELQDPRVCADTGACKTVERRGYRGVSTLISVDASSLVSEVFKRLTSL